MITNKTKIEPRLGEGVFSLRDVAQILNLSPAKVSRWLSEYWGKHFGVFGSGEKGEIAVNFKVLVEFMVFATLRENNYSVSEIFNIHEILSNEFNTAFPFANRQLFFDDTRGKKAKNKSIWHDTYGDFSKADGKKQLVFSSIIRPTLVKIEFDSKSNSPIRFYPVGKDRKVVIDPKFQFGQPTILGTGIRAEIINDLFLGGTTIENICQLYDVNQQEVEDVIFYFGSRHQKKSAA